MPTPQEIREGPARKLKLRSDGSYHNSFLVDAETGQRIKGLQKVELTITGGRVTSAVLHMHTIELDLVAQVTTMGDAELVSDPPLQHLTETVYEVDALQLPDDIAASQKDPQVYYNREEPA